MSESQDPKPLSEVEKDPFYQFDLMGAFFLNSSFDKLHIYREL